MIKHFCDLCKKEVKRNYVSNRFTPRLGKHYIQVTVAIDGCNNDGAICKSCLDKIYKEGVEA